MNRYNLYAFKREPLPEVLKGSRWIDRNNPKRTLYIRGTAGKEDYSCISSLEGNCSVDKNIFHLHFKPHNE